MSRLTGVRLVAVWCVLTLGVTGAWGAAAEATNWYSGTWDSSIYNLYEHPRTVAVRVAVVDAETRLPLSGVQVAITGRWIEQRVGRAHGDDEASKPLAFAPREREYRLEAVTGRDGVAVFALGWRKEYPWRTYFGRHAPREQTRGGWVVQNSWIRAVDDIEKAQAVEVRHPQYRFAEFRLPFSRFLESDVRDPRRFEERWSKEGGRSDVRYFVLDLGTQFPGYQDTESTRAEFFERVRDREWGRLLTRRKNLMTRGDPPQSICGPYFAYEYEVRMVRRAGQEDVRRRSRPEPSDRRPSRDRDAEHRREEANRRAEEETRRREVEREDALRRQREEEGRRREEAARREAERNRSAEQAACAPAGSFAAAFGASVVNVPRELGLATGVLVRSVAGGSIAQQLGIQEGDVIVRASWGAGSTGNEPLMSEAAFRRFVSGVNKGDRFQVTVMRREQRNWRYLEPSGTFGGE